MPNNYTYQSPRAVHPVPTPEPVEGKDEFRQVDPYGGLGQFGREGLSGYEQGGQDLTSLAERLRRRATGQESLSAQQLRTNLGQTLAAQRSMAAGARGGNQAASAREALTTMGRQRAGLAGRTRLAGMAERQAAQSALAQLLAEKRQQDIGGGMGGYQGIEDARGNRNSIVNAPSNEPSGLQKAAQAAIQGMVTYGVATASDRRLKKNIEPGDAAAAAFLESITPYIYDYIDSAHGEGKQLGILAQDLEQTPLGSQAVVDTPEGKMVHGAKLTTALVAVVAHMHKRLKALEG